jgi:ATP-binding cassette subfamily C protein
LILGRLPAERVVTQLRAPSQSYEVEHVTVVPPGSRNAVLSEVNFRLEAGEALGIIGPSGAGKTSLVRTLLGIWPAARGSIRLDGAKLDQWNAERLGRHIGFVSQNVDLFDGTIAENISRMSPTADSDSILEAASRAGAHTMILGMPGGYDMRIGDGGAALSGGQRQRIALARALYGNPFLLVLDEAGSNLDHEGEAALSTAIHETKARGGIVIVIGHRPTAIAPCDKVLVLAGGSQKAFGPREDVLRSLRSPQNLAVPAANLKVVRESTGAER